MTRSERIQAFHTLGSYLKYLNNDDFQTLAWHAASKNPWFTQENVRMAVDSILSLLEISKLEEWLSAYKETSTPRKVGVVMAGNIPLVGFHDALCILISGHSLLAKVSSKDYYLPTFLFQKLIEFEPRFENYIHVVDQLKGIEAVIATGSDNSARYFEYYFGKYPHIIRKNRTSIAILTGNETSNDLTSLGIDIFSYFGLGCRNVSKVLIPASYDIRNLYPAWQAYESVIHHHKYCNNYDYQKSIMLVNGVSFLDNGFVMLHETEKLVSPISVVYYSKYNSEDNLKEYLELNADKIQCIIGNASQSTIPFGQGQHPALSDYADQVDTMKFLSNLN